jgi:hypothetical protein
MGLSAWEKENVGEDNARNSRHELYGFLLAVSVCLVQGLQEGSRWRVLDEVKAKFQEHQSFNCIVIKRRSFAQHETGTSASLRSSPVQPF